MNRKECATCKYYVQIGLDDQKDCYIEECPFEEK